MKNPDYDALARFLDGDLPDGEATAEARALGAVAQMLAASARAPVMENKAELRAALIESARQQASAPSLLSRFRQTVDESTSRWRYSVRMAAATGASAMALSSGGVALAAHNATPSDPLFYDVKLVFEDIRTAFIGDPVERGQQLLAYAERRMAEAEAAAAAGDMDAARRALAEADATARSGAGYIIRASQDQGDPSLLAILDKFAANNRKRLAALLPSLTGEAATAAEDAMVGMRRINQRLAILSGPCGKCGVDSAHGRKQTRAQKVAAANPDFDFSDIPPASEPFAACPCVTNDADTGTATGDKAKTKDAKKTAAKKKAVATEGATGGTGGTGAAPGDGGGKAPTGEDPGEKPGEEPGEDPADQLPEPVREPVKEAEDVIEDVIDNPPSGPPSVPPPPDPDLPDLP